MSEMKHTEGLRLVNAASSLERATNTVRDCCSCIETRPPAFSRRCKGCIDDDERPNWFPKNGADLEYLSWFTPRAALSKAAPKGEESNHG